MGEREVAHLPERVTIGANVRRRGGVLVGAVTFGDRIAMEKQIETNRHFGLGPRAGRSRIN